MKSRGWALIKDAETRVRKITDGLSNTLMFVEKASAPDVYRGSWQLTPQVLTNQTIAALDHLGQQSCMALIHATGDKRKNE